MSIFDIQNPGIPISQLQRIETGPAREHTSPPDFAKFMEEMQLSPQKRQAQLEKQAAEPQKMVFRVNGEIIGTRGQNDFTTFFKGSSAVGAGQFLNDDELVAALKERYGKDLQVEKFAGQNMPSYADIHESVHGSPLRPEILHQVQSTLGSPAQAQTQTAFSTQQIAQTEPDVVEEKTDAQRLAEGFLEYMDKTPEEIYREMILREKGLTEESLAELPPEEQQKIEEEIQEEIEERILRDAEEKG